ncbi:MAG: ATP-binding protein [Burkholderiales bacterium]
MIQWLPRLIARTRASVHAKLLVAFLIIVAMMLATGAVGIRALNDVNLQNMQMVQLQRKIAAYRQLNYDTVSQLYSVSSALLKPDERTLEATLRQLNQFGYNLDRLEFVAHDEAEIFALGRREYEEFIRVVTRVIELIREGRAAEGHALQIARATPLADQLERLTNELVNKAEAEMVESVEASQAAYVESRRLVLVFAVACILAALALGYGISLSLIGPVRRMETRMREIAAGDFSGRVEVPNRDELGALAADLNAMSERLGRLYRELEAASEHKSEFLASMSHELRTPLNAVIGFSEVLREKMFGELNAKQLEYVNDIHSSGRHLLSLINDILDLSKIEAGKVELALTQFDLAETIENTLTLVRERAARHGLGLSLLIDKRVGTIRADERKVRQVLLNLLSNAVKFTGDGGKVDVCARLCNGAVEISVSDTGIGVAPEDQERIFEEFQQVGGNQEIRREGTGLGLTLARRFAELHDGGIRVESTLGKGSVFTFTLPVSSITGESTPKPGIRAAGQASIDDALRERTA